MVKNKTKIVLDADVIIHFSKGGYLSLLPDIFPEYDYVVLSTVYNEVKLTIRTQLDNIITLLHKIYQLDFEPSGDMKREYAMLSGRFGKGESACMAYCRFNHDVIGSSNLKDITGYCEMHQMIYLTTIDFLYYAIRRGLMTIEEAEKFVDDVIKKGSILPKIDFSKFVSQTII